MLVKFGSRKIQVNLTMDSTVDQLKREIELIEGMPMLEQRLITSGKQLSQGETTLSDCGLSEGSVLLLLHQTNSSRNITLYVRTIQRELDFKLSVSLSDSIGSIRSLINERVSLPDTYNLVYNGIVLTDTQTVLDYGLRDRSSVYIVTQIVMEVENLTGERVKMRINDNRITGEVVERLVEQRRAVKKRKHAMREERRAGLASMSSTSTMATAVTPATTATDAETPMFSGLRRGFLNPTGPRKRVKTSSDAPPSVPPTSCAAAAAVTTDTVTTSSSCDGSVETLSSGTMAKIMPPINQDINSSIASPLHQTAAAVETVIDVPQPLSSPTIGAVRCFQCLKRVGLTAIKCRCTRHFCGAHRYPEEHKCDFDYRTENKSQLAKANPKVEAPKVVYIGK